MPAVIIGFGKQKGGRQAPSMPPPQMPSRGRGAAPKPPSMPGQDSPETPGTLTPEEVCYKDNDLCGTCAHMQGDQCEKYSIPVTETGHCAAGYEAGNNAGDDGAAGGADVDDQLNA